MSEHFEAEYWAKRLAGISDAYESQAVEEYAEARDFFKAASSPNMVEHPPHYNYGAIEVIDYIEQVTDSYEGRRAYLAGNIIKYVSRAPHKNGAEDIRKAIWYAERLAEDMEREKDAD